MAKTVKRGSRNDNRGSGRRNNPAGTNQYSGVLGSARANPLTAAVAVGSAVAAGVLFWSRRSQLSEQIGNLSDQISEWREGRNNDPLPDGSTTGDELVAKTSRRAGRRSQSEIAEEALTLKETGHSG